MATDAIPAKRRRFRVSLRVVMLLVLVIGLWMGYRVNKARKQREAVAAVKAYGGWVHYDWEFVNGNLARNTQPRVPKWFRKLLGDEYFQEIAQVSLVYDDSTGTRYDIKNLDAADKVLTRLAGQAGIRELWLQKSQATDQGIRHLQSLTNLERLLIWDASEVSDVGVAHLVPLKNLIYIHINNSKMSDGGLASLAKLPKLETLSLQGNNFSDAGLASLKDSTNLKQLHVGIGESRITDDGMTHLKNLKNLELLDVQNTAVTDSGLNQLRGLTKLKEMWLGQTKITEEGIVRFKAAMPNLKVIR
jgi:hypothetical protein